jgi:hypothetical protein
MDIVVQFTEREEARVLPILLRQSPGVVLPDRTYVLSETALQAVRTAGISFRELSRNGLAAANGGVAAGERI